MSQTVVLKVSMSCQGCAGAVQRALGKMEGVDSFDVSLKEQKVTVKGNAQPEAVFETVSKTGKKTSFWEEPVSAPASAPEPAPASAPEPAPAADAKPAPAADPEPAPAADPEPAPAAAPEPAPAAAPEPAPAAEAEAKPAEPVSVA